MRNARGLGLLVAVCGVSLLGSQAAVNAAVGVYHIDYAVSSQTAVSTNTGEYPPSYDGPVLVDAFDSVKGGSYLAPWTTTVASPSSVPAIAEGTAVSLGSLNASVNSDGFSASGSAYAEAHYLDTRPTPPAGAVDTLYATSTSSLTFNFKVPDSSTAQQFDFTGSAFCPAGNQLLVLITKFSGSVQTPLVNDDYLGVSAGHPGNKRPSGDTLLSYDSHWTIQPGELVEVKLYASSAPMSESYADASGDLNSTAYFNVTGVVPEPTALATGIAGTVLLGIRKRSKIASR